MSYHPQDNRQPPSPELAVIIGALIAVGLVIAARAVSQLPVTASTVSTTGQADQASLAIAEVTQVSPTFESPGATVSVEKIRTPFPTPIPSTSTPSPTSTSTSTPIHTPTPSNTPSPTVTPTPTLNLAKCNAAGCGLEAKELPAVEYVSGTPSDGGAGSVQLEVTVSDTSDHREETSKLIPMVDSLIKHQIIPLSRR